MVARLRVATFNTENLLSTLPTRFEDGSPRWGGPLRYLKRDRLAAPEALAEALALVAEDEQRRLGALLIASLDADVICLQEVESEPVLRQFRNEYLDPLTGGAHRHLKLMEGNDGRGIDVAVLSRLPLENVRNHVDLRFGEVEGAFSPELARTVDRYRDGPHGPATVRYPSPGDFVFRRGCLAVDVAPPGGRAVSIYVAHLKSMGTTLGPSFASDRDYTAPLRRAEALAIRRLVRERFGRGAADALYVIAGDLNDYAVRNGVETPLAELSIAPLLDPSFAYDALADLPVEDRWTHWYDVENAFGQIDYVLLSPALRRANPSTAPDIERRGLPWRTPWRPADAPAPGAARSRRVTGNGDRSAALRLALEGLLRFPGVGWERPRASDHAAVAVTLALPE